MKYRSEIDGIRSLAVISVIFFHAGFELFSGGFVGVDIFFVISGYLITTIIVDDITKQQFTFMGFYERRVRRLLPALLFVLIVTAIVAFFLLYPSSMKSYSESLLSVLGFVSNIYFWRESDYFATEAELIPLIHTWSLSVEAQFYVVFPIFILLVWRFGIKLVFWIIVVMAIISLVLSEWGWRNHLPANFYLAPTRFWELLAGAIAALIIRRKEVQKSNLLSMLGLVAIIYAIFVYDEGTPFPSSYSLVPVLGTVFLILFAGKDTMAARFLSTRILVGVGLVSYSAYLWHQPIFAFYRREFGIDLGASSAILLILATFVAAAVTWKFIEVPFRNRKLVSSSSTLIFCSATGAALLVVALVIFFTNGASFRYNFPPPPVAWENVKCHGAAALEVYKDPLNECLGDGKSSLNGGDLYLLGDSHATQLTFALKEVSAQKNLKFHFINDGGFPKELLKKNWAGTASLDHLSNIVSQGDYLVLAFHRGYLNPKRDLHYEVDYLESVSQKSEFFEKNLDSYMKLLESKNINVVLVKDGPLLNSHHTNVERCMYEFQQSKKKACVISFDLDNGTRFLQSKVFDSLSAKFDFVKTIDYLNILYSDGYFSPISSDGEYLMFDRHHLTENASKSLAPFFSRYIKQH